MRSTDLTRLLAAMGLALAATSCGSNECKKRGYTVEEVEEQACSDGYTAAENWSAAFASSCAYINDFVCIEHGDYEGWPCEMSSSLYNTIAAQCYRDRVFENYADEAPADCVLRYDWEGYEDDPPLCAL